MLLVWSISCGGDGWRFVKNDWEKWSRNKAYFYIDDYKYLMIVIPFLPQNVFKKLKQAMVLSFF